MLADYLGESLVCFLTRPDYDPFVFHAAKLGHGPRSKKMNVYQPWKTRFKVQQLRYEPLAGAVLVSSYIPLLFMGKEWGETNPFYYFVSHSDPDLIEAVGGYCCFLVSPSAHFF